MDKSSAACLRYIQRCDIIREFEQENEVGRRRRSG
jgi:hypothetical protein